MGPDVSIKNEIKHLIKSDKTFKTYLWKNLGIKTGKDVYPNRVHLKYLNISL